MLVVCDTSPIRALSAIDKLHLLPALYGNSLVPPAVVRELSVQVPGMPALDVLACGFLEERVPANSVLVRELRTRLGEGEAEAIALAIEVQAGGLLIDEYRGRQIAINLGVRPIGVLGVLTEAKSRGIVPALAPLIEELRTRIGFRLSDQLVERVLRGCGE